MTNKTITPACCTCGNPTACGKMICEECCYEPLPVPPAGVEPEGFVEFAQTWLYHRYGPVIPVESLSEIDLESEDMKPLYATYQAHVTRLQAEVRHLRQHKNDYMEAAEETRKALQAEVERLQDQLADAKATANLAVTNLKEFKEDHQSELTKARELLSRILKSGVLSFEGEPSQEQTALECEVCAFLSNQSAPADSGGDL